MKYILVILFLLLISKGYCLQHENIDQCVAERGNAVIRNSHSETFIFNVLLDDDNDTPDKLEYDLLVPSHHKFNELEFGKALCNVPEFSILFINSILPDLIDLPPPPIASLGLNRL